jgi:2-polyprenyl-3-methyl-5-hydroxy-6-metoxy-1,4-benzoquinol methylase
MSAPLGTPMLAPPLSRLAGAPASTAPDEEERARCHGKRIGILIVAYNAVSTLDRVLKRITPSVWKNVEEVAVFDDASQDATAELAVGYKATRDLSKLQVLRHADNLGYGGNQKAGYRYFIEKGFDIVVLLHGDGQYAPEILSHLYEPLVRGNADAVFGSRMTHAYGGPIKGGMPYYKYIGNRILTHLENRALGMDLSEFHSGYRAYDLKALSQIQLDRMTEDFHFDTEIIIKLHHQGYRIAEVPIPTYYGTEICYVNGMKYARDVARALHRYKQTSRGIARYPEFEEYFVHYPIKRTRGSSHDIARRLVGSHHDVLDIGCGLGFLAEQLSQDGNVVDGIDVVPDTVSKAGLHQYRVADLEAGLPSMGGKCYDRVLLLDVLEHLRFPERILRAAHQFIKPNGVLIVSVPNIANITVRASLLAGRFEYEDRGILDRTHLRFFTRKTARRLLVEQGFEIVHEHMSIMPIELKLGLPETNPFLRLLQGLLRRLTRVLPGLLGYQTILVARSAPGQRQPTGQPAADLSSDPVQSSNSREFPAGSGGELR